MRRAIFHVTVVSVLLAISFCVSIPQAIAQIAPGVTQSAAQTATITGTVTQSDGTPVVSADVRLNGSNAHLTTVSDAHGTFIFTTVPYGTYRIDVSSGTLGMASRDAIVLKGDLAVAIRYTATQTAGGLKTIAQVSTRSAGAQINVTPASIASINPSNYAFEGNTSWKALLAQIPGVTVGGDLGEGREAVVPNSPVDPIVLSINGAQPYETSITLDGMPLASQSLTSTPGNGVDLSYLPMSMFETADVVRGPGADAPSILDSIGGSFVLHAPGPVDKDRYDFSLSNDAYGGTVANAKVALRIGRLSATLAYSMDDSPGPLGFGGITPLSPLFGGEASVNGQTLISNLSYTSPPINYTTDSLFLSGGSLHSAWVQHSGAIALSYNVSPSVTAEVFYTGTSSITNCDLGEYEFEFAPGASYSGSLAPGQEYMVQNGTPTNGFPESSNLLEEKATVNIGRGVLRLAALQGRSGSEYVAPIQPNGVYTLYGTTAYANAPNTPVTFNGTSEFVTFSSYTETLDEWSNNRDLLASYATQVGSNSSLGVSYVTSYYNDPSYNDFIDPSAGFVEFSNSQTSSISSTTDELRFSANTQLSDKISLDASWYFVRGMYHVPNPNSSDCVTSFTGGVFTSNALPPSSYSDSTDSYSAPRLGATWRVSPDAVVRAAAGGGYALPPLYELIGTNGATSCSTTYCEVTLTNLNLQPEKSFGFDIGTDMRLHHNTVLSFDLYHTNLYGQFFESSLPSSACSICHGLPLYITEEENLAQSRMEGINIDLHHDVPRGMYWSGALGLIRGYDVSVPAGFYNTATCTNCTNQYLVPGINYDGYFQSTVPYANGTATIGYRWEPGKYVDLSPIYYGNNNAYYHPAFLEFDAHAGYPLTRNVSLLATFRNISGIYGQSQNIVYHCPCLTAPVIAGAPEEENGLYGLPYGPRSVIVTLNIHE